MNVDIQAMRALLYPATRTVYATMDIRAKTNARVAILQALPALLDEVEQLREEVGQLDAANRLHALAAEAWRRRAEPDEAAIERAAEALWRAEWAEGFEPDHDWAAMTAEDHTMAEAYRVGVRAVIKALDRV